MLQTIVKVETDPPGKEYFVVPATDLPKGTPPGSRDIPLAQAGDLERFLAGQISDYADGSGFRFAIGTYTLIVRCDDRYRLRLIEIQPGTHPPFKVSCR
jgi:hypothetical protein